MARAYGIPGVVIAAAVIMFVYGGLLLLCVTCSGISLAAKPPDHMGLQEALDKEAPGHNIVPVVVMGFNFLFAVGFIAAGFGVLWHSQIARYATYLICLAIFLITLASTIYNAVVVSPVTERVMQRHMFQQAPGQRPPIDMGPFLVGGRILGIMIALGIPLLFCAPIVILLSVKSARDAFAGKIPAPPAEDEERRSRYRGDDDDYRPPSREPKFPGDTGIQE